MLIVSNKCKNLATNKLMNVLKYTHDILLSTRISNKPILF